LTSRTLKIAGWLAMASAFLTLPLAYLSYSMEGRTDVNAAMVLTIIQISGIILYIAIVLCFKRLINTHFHFHNTDRNIHLMILAEAVSGVFSVAALYVSPLKETLVQVVLVILVAQAIVQVLFGFNLLKLPDNLDGMLKPFCYANIATGIFLASVVLIPLGILASALSDLMIGTIFFNLSKRVKDRDSKSILT
jgi:hypothetical protein